MSPSSHVKTVAIRAVSLFIWCKLSACSFIRQADYAEERLDAIHEFQEELDEALRIRKMVETGLHNMALDRLMASTEARRTSDTFFVEHAPVQCLLRERRNAVIFQCVAHQPRCKAPATRRGALISPSRRRAKCTTTSTSTATSWSRPGSGPSFPLR